MFPQHNSRRLCLFLAGIFAFQALRVPGAPLEQSVSTSRQFIVYGTDVSVRGAICELAENTKRDLLALLAQRDSWATPIVINAHYPQANLPEAPRTALALSQTGFGLKLQLDLTIDPRVSRPQIRRELLRALLVEMMYRETPDIPAGATYSSPPDWLLDGVPAHALNQDFVRPILSLPVARRAILPLETFLRQQPESLDGPARALYRAYSFALVELLARAPDGPNRMGQFILDLASASNDPLANLRGHFPELFGNDALAAKTWKAQVARFSEQKPYQLLGSAETEHALDQVLRLKISVGSRERIFELAEFPVFLKEPSARRALSDLSRDLSALGLRANPAYRPIVSNYARIVALLLHGKTKGVEERLKRLTDSRKAVAVQLRQIDDYLNWFEATGLRGLSGAFADYLKTAEAAAAPPPARHDHISAYLDALETHFQE